MKLYYVSGEERVGVFLNEGNQKSEVGVVGNANLKRAAIGVIQAQITDQGAVLANQLGDLISIKDTALGQAHRMRVSDKQFQT